MMWKPAPISTRVRFGSTLKSIIETTLITFCFVLWALFVWFPQFLAVYLTSSRETILRNEIYCFFITYGLITLFLFALELFIEPRRSAKVLFRSARQIRPPKKRTLFTKTYLHAQPSHHDDAVPILEDNSMSLRFLRDRSDGTSSPNNMTVDYHVKHLPTIPAGAVPDENDASRTYCYKPLADTEIRLLQIEHTSDASHTLHAKMQHVPLLSARARGYIALSYTWGDQEATSDLIIDGRTIRIRPNLAKILRKLRSLKYASIWVDAICVNQDNVQELGAQVLRMQGIYAGAQTVLVAIDASEQHARDVLRVLSLVNSVLTAANQDAGLAISASEPSVQSALDAFCNDAYWKRIWIVQEYSIGHKINLLIGNTVVGVRDFEMVLSLCKSKNEPSSSVNHRWAQVDAIMAIRASWVRNEPVQLLDILKQTQLSMCGRRHDRVFGLLGLVSDHLEFLSEASYESDLPVLAAAMTQSYVERHSLDIVLLAEHQGVIKDLPTWSPAYFWFDDFTPHDRLWDVARRHQALRIQDTSLSTVKSWRATPFLTANCEFHEKKLISAAYRIGKICSLGSAWSDDNDGQYPKHNEKWASANQVSDVRDMMWEAMLTNDYHYNLAKGCQATFGLQAKLSMQSQVLQAYTYVHAFLPSHGSYDPEKHRGKLPRWICANRNFFAGGMPLQDHAKRLWPAFFHCGPATWSWTNPFTWRRMSDVFHSFTRMAKSDMRLMCLDQPCFGIGWAAKHADLHDEIFLLPGCSVPVVLRKTERTGQYHFVGDAIVIGAMENEVWGRLEPSDLCRVEII